MIDIQCICGNQMEFIVYIPTVGKNAFNEIKALYKCKSCKDIQLIDMDRDEFNKDVYTIGVDLAIKEQTSGMVNTYIIYNMVNWCLLVFTLILFILFWIIIF